MVCRTLGFHCHMVSQPGMRVYPGNTMSLVRMLSWGIGKDRES